MRNKRIAVRVTEQELKKIKMLATREQRTVSELIRLTIIETLKYE